MKIKFNSLVKGCFILFLVSSLYSCTETLYTHKWDLVVFYTDGTKDTLSCEYNSHHPKGLLRLSTSTGGLLSNSGHPPCVEMSHGVFTKPVACDVRRFEILSHNTEILK
jgi:hypothetical protein